jgi:hypothetical protein
LVLALSWCGRSPPPIDGATDIDVLEAVLLAHARSEEGDVDALINLASHPARDDLTTLPYVLRHCRDVRASKALERLSSAGVSAATFALQARSAGKDGAQSRRVASDPDHDVRSRRLAAWRWDRIDESIVLDILSADPGEPDDSVFAAAMLAERRLGPETASDLAEAWITDLDDDFKRAGALLAGLLGEHQDLLRARFEIEDVTTVRTIQALVMGARDSYLVVPDFWEFAYRALHEADGEFNPDTAVCLLLAGDRRSLKLLTSRPTADARQSVQQRSWLVERFVPTWFADVGRPVGGDRRALDLHFDALDMRRMLDQRRLQLDEATGTWVE